MFFTAFPTNLDPIPTETISIGYHEGENINFRTNFKHRTSNKFDEKSLGILTPTEINPAFMRVGNLGIPFTSGTIGLNTNYETGLSSVLIGYEKDTQAYTMLDGRLLPTKFTDKQSYTKSLTFHKFIFDIFARATLLEADAAINTPTTFGLNWPDEDGEHATENSSDRYRCERENEEYLALRNGIWITTKGPNMFELKTGKPIEGKFDRYECMAYSLHGNYGGHGPKSKFSFHTPHRNDSSYHHRTMYINMPCDAYDPELGHKLFKALGIKYDTYSNPEFKDDVLDPKQFMAGSEQYGVVRCKVYRIDPIKASEMCSLYLEKVKDPANKQKRKEGRFQPRNSLDMFDRPGQNYLAINLKGGLTDDILNVLVLDWRVGNFIRTILNAKINKTAKEGEANVVVESFFGRSMDSSRADQNDYREQQFEILKALLTEVEIDVPFFTPRFNEEVCAALNYVFSNRHESCLNNFPVMYNPTLSKFYEQYGYYQHESEFGDAPF